MSDLSTSKETAKQPHAAAMATSYKYQTVQLTLTNVTAGMPVTVVLGSRSGTIQWSSGNPAQSGSSGINMAVTSGTLPLQSFQVTKEKVGFTVSGTGSAIAFTFNAFLCADLALQDFTAELQSAPTSAMASLTLQGQTAQNLTLGKAVPVYWDGSALTKQ